MDTKQVTVLVWDDPSNFHLEETQRSFGNKNVFKDVFQFKSLEEFKRILENITEEENLVFACHVNVKDFSLYTEFKYSNIKEEFNIPTVNYLSSDGDTATQKSKIKFGQFEKILFYDQFISQIKTDDIRTFKKSYIDRIRPDQSKNSTDQPSKNHPQCDYVIVTALEEDEMEKVLPMIVSTGRIKDDKHLIEYGHLASNEAKKIAFASQSSTGMIDAAILTTKMITLFKPRFVIMTGVLGGKPVKTKIGDIVVSTKVFTIDKGKITDEEYEKEIEASLTENAYTTLFKRNKSKIIDFIDKSDATRNVIPEIHFEPVACVRQVIDKKNYFIENITTRDRKAIALEMESYGVTRSCELTSNGTVIPIIVKSVMDNTMDKTDNAKTYAAWTSAMFIKYVLENNLL